LSVRSVGETLETLSQSEVGRSQTDFPRLSPAGYKFVLTAAGEASESPTTVLRGGLGPTVLDVCTGNFLEHLLYLTRS
jgi:hypothetical protein